jgi:sigma-B regulation protein RsbU (phosphoserine phosphatase)
MTEPGAVVPTLELIGKSGPARVYRLGTGTFRIGRERSSDVWLDDKRVSAAHARIIGEPDGTYLVEDLRSYNSTYLDGQPLAPFVPATLRDGSRIRICEYTLVFQRPTVELRHAGAGEPTIIGTLDDMSSVSLSARGERAPAVLRAVLEINRVLGGTLELGDVLDRALRELLQIFTQAECGFVLTEEFDGKLCPRATRRRESAAGPDAPITLSRTVLEHVMRGGKGLIVSSAEGVGEIPLTESFDVTGIRTALCAPVFGRGGRPIGIIQLDSRRSAVSFGPEDLELLAAVAVPIGVVVENHRLMRERAALVAAGEVQAALLPRRRPSAPGYESWEHYQPALEVGGDYYDYIPVETRAGPGPDGQSDSWVRWAVALGDVSGKGMPAALLMANLSAEVRHLVRAGYPPEAIAERVNRDLYDAGIPGKFVTFLLLTVDADSHRLAVVNAGHYPPLVRRAGGSTEALGCAESSLPLGVERDVPYRRAETVLGPGDVVVLFTDGVNEAMGRDDSQLGVGAVARVLAAEPGGAEAAGRAILQAVRTHTDGLPQSDDIALVCFGRD